MDVTVRPMMLKDYEGICRVDALTQKQFLGDKWDLMSPSEQEEHMVSRKPEFQINVDTGYCFVALINDQIIGFLLAHEMLPFHGTLYTRYIGLDPEEQGKGIGLLLYQKLIEKAKETNIKEIKALINIDNPMSMNLHKKAGFTLKDRKEAVLKISK